MKFRDIEQTRHQTPSARRPTTNATTFAAHQGTAVPSLGTAGLCLKGRVQPSQACSQKFGMGGCVGGVGAEPPAAGGQRGSGGEAAPIRRRHGGLETKAPALENFAFFCKSNLILELF